MLLHFKKCSTSLWFFILDGFLMMDMNFSGVTEGLPFGTSARQQAPIRHWENVYAGDLLGLGGPAC